MIVHNLIVHNLISEVVNWTMYSLTNMIGTLCIYLTFTFNGKEYNILCRSCDQCCAKLCNITVKWLYGTQLMMTEISRHRSRSTPNIPDINTVNTPSTINSDEVIHTDEVNEHEVNGDDIKNGTHHKSLTAISLQLQINEFNDTKSMYLQCKSNLTDHPSASSTVASDISHNSGECTETVEEVKSSTITNVNDTDTSDIQLTMHSNVVSKK